MKSQDDDVIELFVKVLAIERKVAELLILNDIRTLEEVAYVPERELYDIEGFRPEEVALMRQRARTHLTLQ